MKFRVVKTTWVGFVESLRVVLLSYQHSDPLEIPARRTHSSITVVHEAPSEKPFPKLLNRRRGVAKRSGAEAAGYEPLEG